MIGQLYWAFLDRRLEKGKTATEFERKLLYRGRLPLPRPKGRKEDPLPLKNAPHWKKADYILRPAVYREEEKGKVLTVPLKFNEGPPPKRVRTHGEILQYRSVR